MAQPSLNEIISLLADRVGQPFNVPLQEQLKVIVGYKRANYTQQFLEQHPDQRRFFWQSFTVDLERIPKGDCDELPALSCDVLRSKCKIPMPMRSSTTLFDFVGTPDWSHAFGFANPEFLKIFGHNRYTKNATKVMYVNEYMYVFNDLSLKKLAVRGVFADPYSVNSCCSVGSTPCITDDSPYPMAQDILNAVIRDVLNVELRNMFPQPGVVTVPEVKDSPNPPTVT